MALYFNLRKIAKSKGKLSELDKKIYPRKVMMAEAPHRAGFVMIGYKIIKNQRLVGGESVVHTII